MRKLTDEDIKEINYLYRNGLSYRKIGKRYNVSGTTIWRKINKNKEEILPMLILELSLLTLSIVVFIFIVTIPIFWARTVVWDIGVLLTFIAFFVMGITLRG